MVRRVFLDKINICLCELSKAGLGVGVCVWELRGVDIWSDEGLNWTKSLRKKEVVVSACFPGEKFFSCVCTRTQIGIYTIGFPSSQAFWLQQNYILMLCSPPACRLQILGLLSFYNWVSLLPILFCFSGEFRVIQCLVWECI